MSIIARMESSAARRTAAGSAPAASALPRTAAASCSIAASVGSRPRFNSSSWATGQFDRAQLGPASFSVLNASIMGASTLQKLFERLAEFRWAWADGYSSRFHRRDLVFGAALAARDDRSGVAHPPPGRSGPAGDEADDGLGAAALRLVGEELRGVLFRRAADL